MATRQPTNAPAEAHTMPPVSTAWTPPANSEKLELSEFVTWYNLGDVVIGRVQAGSFRERPDPLDPNKIMQSIVLSPVAVLPRGVVTKGEAFHSLALGLSSHLQLLLPNVRTGGVDGQAFAIVYDGERAPTKPGQRKARQFNVYRLTEVEFRAELAKVADVDDLPF